MVVVIVYYHSLRVARFKYVISWALTLHQFQKSVWNLWAMVVFFWMANSPLMLGLLWMKCAITLWNAWKILTYILSQHLRKPLMFQATKISSNKIFHFIIWFKARFSSISCLMVTNLFLMVTDLLNFFPKVLNKCLSFLTKSLTCNLLYPIKVL